MPPPPNPAAEAAAAAHLLDMETRDVAFAKTHNKRGNWKSNSRRNKNVKTMLTDAARKDNTTVENSGQVSPVAEDTEMSGTEAESTPRASTLAAPNLTQASHSLAKTVLERNTKNQAAGVGLEIGMASGGSGGMTAPMPTYSNIEAGPSMAHAKRYCDITGLKGTYHCPKTRLYYHNKEVYAVVNTLPPGVGEQYLEARGAHTVLK